MDGKTTYFTTSITDICLNTIKRYKIIHNKPLNLYNLIKLAIKDDDYMLVDFLINRRLTYIKQIIYLNTINYGFTIKELDIEYIMFYGQTLTENQYTNKLIYYMKRAGNFIDDLIKEICNHKDWTMLHYIYSKEKQRIIEYAKQEDEAYEESLKLKNKKFFILQF